MKNPDKLNFSVFFIFGFSMQTAIAQTQITHQIISNGGATMSNGSYSLTGTVGQPAIGFGSSADHTLSGGFWAQAGVVVTSVEEIQQNALPETFRLDQNYPNPFNPTTTIQFAVAQRSHVSLKLFDLLGRQVAALVEEEMTAGEYKLQFEAAHLPSGIYFYILKADHFVASKKLTLLK